MAGGWAKDGAVSKQIEASINDELARLKARRTALPGVKLCIDCMSERDATSAKRGGINRRGSKDSQLK